MQYVFGMHDSKALSHQVEAPANKVFAEVAAAFKDDISHSAAFHELEDDPDAPLVVPDALAADQLLAVQVLD